MKKSLVILSLFLSGCYLGNGSPSSVEFWVKNNKSISATEIWKCEREVYATIDQRSLALYNKFRNGDRLTDNEHKEFFNYTELATPLVRKCYYDLGYRFRPPLYWCLAQDGNNTSICMDNMKYRN